MTTAEGFALYSLPFFDADPAFELYLNAVGTYNDLFYQLFEYGAVIRIHDATVTDMLFEGVRPRFYLCVSLRIFVLPAVIDCVLVVLAALTALDDASERVLWHGLSDQFLVLPL